MADPQLRIHPRSHAKKSVTTTPKVRTVQSTNPVANKGGYHIAFDISDYTIEVVAIKWDFSDVRVQRVHVKRGVVEQGVIRERAVVQKVCSDMVQAMGFSDITDAKSLRMSIPDAQTFVHTFSVPAKDGKVTSTLAERVHEEVARNVPLPTNELTTVYTVAPRGDTGVVCTISTKLQTCEEYRMLLQTDETEKIECDTEVYALGTSILPGRHEGVGTALVIDIGSRTTNTHAYAADGEICASYTVPHAGETVTRILAETLQKPYSDADNIKKYTGFLETSNSKTKRVMQSVYETILSDSAVLIDQFKTRAEFEPVSEIILTGGSALTPGLVGHVATYLNIPTYLGDPMRSLPNIVTEIKPHPVCFSVALGCALRSEAGDEASGQPFKC